MATRRNNYFVDGEGISREVITADICKYLDNDATVRPGSHNGREGFIVTAYRNLTTAQIEDLRNDSLKWEEERRRDAARRAQNGRATGQASYAHSQTRMESNNPYGPSVPSPVQSASSTYPPPPGTGYPPPLQEPVPSQRDYRPPTQSSYHQETSYVPVPGPQNYPPSTQLGYGGHVPGASYGRDPRAAQQYDYNNYPEPGYGPQLPYSPPQSLDDQYTPQVRSYPPPQAPPQPQQRPPHGQPPPGYPQYPPPSGSSARYGERR